MKEKINIMFVGLGSIGQRHLRNLKKILKGNVRFFAFRKSRCTPLLDFNGKKIKGNVEEKYSISVTSKLNLVNKKIHIIFIEKPLDSSLSKYQDFLKYIKKNNLKIFVGYNLRFHPGFEKLKKLIRIKKEFNKIKYAIFKCGENLRKFHEYENYLISYASNKRLGGGVNLNNSHEIDMMLDLFGNATILNSYKDNLSNLKIDEIKKIFLAFKIKKVQLCLLHCVSSYPNNDEGSYLSNIQFLKNKFKCTVGISDHTDDIKIPLYGVLLGAEIVEKHFRINKNHRCIDEKVSITAKQFHKMRYEIDQLRIILNKPKFGIRPEERNTKIFKRNRIF